jgi:hypothetical protein
MLLLRQMLFTMRTIRHTDTLRGQNAQFCNIYKSSSYLTGNTLHNCYKAQPINAVVEADAIYCENLTEHTDTLQGQNAEFCNTTNPVRTSQETLYVYNTKPSRLIWLGNSRCLF